MNIKYVLLTCLVFTLIFLGYVNLQVEVVKMSYDLRNKEKQFASSLDQNRLLTYNNLCLKSPKYLSGMAEINEMNLILPDPRDVAQMKILYPENVHLAKSSSFSEVRGRREIFAAGTSIISGTPR